MKRLSLAVMFLAVCTLCGAEFTRDFSAAKTQAAKENKKILAVFSGSDWCPPCMNLEKKILSQKKFKDEAGKKYVLFFADYPRKKILPNEETMQNRRLLQEYRVRAFPTVMVMDAKGKVLKSNQGAPALSISGFLNWADSAR